MLPIVLQNEEDAILLPRHRIGLRIHFGLIRRSRTNRSPALDHSRSSRVRPERVSNTQSKHSDFSKQLVTTPVREVW